MNKVDPMDAAAELMAWGLTAELIRCSIIRPELEKICRNVLTRKLQGHEEKILSPDDVATWP